MLSTFSKELRFVVHSNGYMNKGSVAILTHTVKSFCLFVDNTKSHIYNIYIYTINMIYIIYIEGPRILPAKGGAELGFHGSLGGRLLLVCWVLWGSPPREKGVCLGSSNVWGPSKCP